MTLYNPHQLARQELVETFVARRDLLDELLDDLRRGGSQHQLLIGGRGAGKTSLLLRLGVAIEDDPQLTSKYIALRFPEEQYNVARLSDFWMNAIDSLIDALERQQDHATARRLEAVLSELEPLDEEARASRSREIVETWARQTRRRVVLLVDNLDLVLERLAGSLWDLREALSRDNRLVVIGGSSTFFHDAIQYESPFYDFFRVHELGPISEAEARQLVLSLARRANTPRVAEVLERDPGRFKTLFVLTGGTPRTLALLHSVLALDTGDRIERDLDALLDQLTPYYKARFDDLAAQSQVIVDAVALHWNPITTAECQAASRLDLNTVSAQLSRLVKSGVLAKVALPEPSKLGFQVAERFFNIWYLMRASRRLRRRLAWFVEFLRIFYGEQDLRQRAETLVRGARPGSLDSPAKLLAFAAAVEDEALRQRLELRAVELLASERMAAIRDVLDLEGEDVHLAPVVDRVKALREIRTRIARAKVKWPAGLSSSEVAELIAREPALRLTEKLQIARHPQKRSPLLAKVVNFSISRGKRDSVGERLSSAIATGEVPSPADVTTPAEVRQVTALAEFPLVAVGWMAVGFIVLEAERGPGALSDDTFRQLLSVDPEAGDLIARLAIPSPEALGWHRVHHLMILVTRHTAKPIPLETWIMVLRAYLAHGRATEALQLFVGAGLSERWAPLDEALRAAAEGRRARLERLAPELRAASVALFDELCGSRPVFVLAKPSDAARPQTSTTAASSRVSARKAGPPRQSKRARSAEIRTSRADRSVPLAPPSKLLAAKPCLPLRPAKTDSGPSATTTRATGRKPRAARGALKR